jgi:hypothetical protein
VNLNCAGCAETELPDVVFDTTRSPFSYDVVRPAAIGTFPMVSNFSVMQLVNLEWNHVRSALHRSLQKRPPFWCRRDRSKCLAVADGSTHHSRAADRGLARISLGVDFRA